MTVLLSRGEEKRQSNGNDNGKARQGNNNSGGGDAMGPSTVCGFCCD
jgi:hypothetical protein